MAKKAAAADPVYHLRAFALAHPDVEEGVACKGTAAECATFNVKGKAFLFVGAKNLRIKLAASLAEATELAAKEPEAYSVGALGWTKITFADIGLPSDKLLERWVAESYGLFAPKAKAVKK